MIETGNVTDPQPPLPSADRKPVGAAILGAGRSGTSAIARAFVFAGYFAGDEDELYGPELSNPLGHYESLAVLDLDEELLARLGCGWWAGLPAPERQLALLDEYGPRLDGTVDAIVGAGKGAPAVVKEPRMTALLPLWAPTLDRFLHPVLAVRDPLEVALSHQARDETSVAHALASWEAQTSLLLGCLHGRTATVAPFGRLAADPDLAARIVADASAHLGDRYAERIDADRAASAMQPDLRHQSGMAALHPEYLTARQAELWEYVGGLPAGDVELDAPEHLRAPGEASLSAIESETGRVRLAAEYGRVAGEVESAAVAAKALAEEMQEAVEAGETALAQAEARHREDIDAITSSASWRVTAPLRWLRNRASPRR